MKKIFVNHTNHPSEQWGKEQRSAAEAYGAIVDVPFPSVSPSAESEEVLELVRENLSKIMELEPVAVLCQGEFTYTFAMVELLKGLGVTVVAACSERLAEERLEDDGSSRRSSTFRFVRFRLY